MQVDDQKLNCYVQMLVYTYWEFSHGTTNEVASQSLQMPLLDNLSSLSFGLTKKLSKCCY